MAKQAFVLLGTTGTVERCHSTDTGVPLNGPTAAIGDLETLISLGYQAKREVPLSSGKVLLVLDKP